MHPCMKLDMINMMDETDIADQRDETDIADQCDETDIAVQCDNADEECGTTSQHARARYKSC